MPGQPETISAEMIGGEIMSRGIERDLFASVMRLSARERTEILEFLGQPAASAEGLLQDASRARRGPRTPVAVSRRRDIRVSDLALRDT
jgi:hypothetical protein